MESVWVHVSEIIITILGLIKAFYLTIWVFHLRNSKNSDQSLTSVHVDFRVSLGMYCLSLIILFITLSSSK